MAGFKTHIATSTVLGVGYGAAGYAVFDAPLTTCMVAAGLCSVSGMLPDLDSDTGVPLRETISIAAAVIPLFLLDRFQSFGLTQESMVLAAGLIYITLRFGVAEIFKRYTVHRGMWHSLPAAAIAGLLAYLVITGVSTELRIYKSAAVVFGFLIHLVLDEWYSIEWRFGLPRLKKSFGTALKLWSKNPWANISTYGKLIVLIILVSGHPILTRRFERSKRPAMQTAAEAVNHAIEQSERLLR